MKPRWLILPVLVLLTASSSGTGRISTVYYTGFEPAEGYNAELDLAGQQGWTSDGSGGNGLVSGFFEGFGQQAYVGYSPPAGQGGGITLWRPLTVASVPASTPVVHFSVLMAIMDSTAARPYYDDFRWSVYNAGGERLFSLDFDNNSFEINVVRDDGSFAGTGRTFTANRLYSLNIRMDFALNQWSASLGGETLVVGQPMTTTGLTLSFGDVDAVWSVRTPGFAGDNYMVFDEYLITAETASAPPPEVRSMGRTDGGDFLVRIFGTHGCVYALEVSSDLSAWTPVRTNTAPVDGILDFIDTTAAGVQRRFYRAREIRE